KAGRDGMARYGLPSDKAFGVSVKDIQSVAKRLGKNHALAAALWKSGWHEARMLACYVDEPERVTAAQMDAWSKRKEEFVRRAAFALLWGLTVHDKSTDDARFTRGLALIESAATDDRHYVKKAVNMALRATGKRN